MCNPVITTSQSVDTQHVSATNLPPPKKSLVTTPTENFLKHHVEDFVFGAGGLLRVSGEAEIGGRLDGVRVSGQGRRKGIYCDMQWDI